ncbi:hypothetical protein NBH00_12775 [Paraconexibacter antarcticus]|uniref:Uncharacterized protein n=1 Tax=Paraconexibacter antarcticus TaxID=2949664 RepID=A0ABY5DMH8_9ACTN|nr:hypothetical protein [Paraconexibacter antarcticus]UTI62242.1 hypothetical protein NBH00_12775 [Paraconexibacter antarcticus]
MSVRITITGDVSVGSGLLPGLRPRPAAARPSTRAQHITFIGSITDGAHFAKETFTVLAGDGGPTPTGGFARWNVIPRPQRKGITVLDGYDPLTLEIPILFDAAKGPAGDVEADIQKLEWMGGRGVLFERTGIGQPARGDSPLVVVSTVDAHGVTSALVPAQYQTDGLRWVVTSLAFDTNPIRNAHGDRTRQAVTVTLTEYVATSFSMSADSPAVRAQARKPLADQFTSFPVTSAHNTIRKITIFDAHNPLHSAAVEVLKANRANRKLHLGPSIDQDLIKHLPLGTHIKVPLSVIKAL